MQKILLPFVLSIHTIQTRVKLFSTMKQFLVMVIAVALGFVVGNLISKNLPV